MFMRRDLTYFSYVILQWSYRTNTYLYSFFYTYMYIYIHTHIYTYIHIYKYIYKHSCWGILTYFSYSILEWCASTKSSPSAWAKRDGMKDREAASSGFTSLRVWVCTYYVLRIHLCEYARANTHMYTQKIFAHIYIWPEQESCV